MLLHALLFAGGVLLILFTLSSAVRTFVLPRGLQDILSRGVFIVTRKLFNIVVHRLPTYSQRDQVMALYAPVSLLLLPLLWVTLVLIGYMCMFRAIGTESWNTAFTVSGSSLLTLGFAVISAFWPTALSFSEAAIGLILVALLITYLPTMYSAFSQREATVALLEVRAGSPPSPVEMLLRFHRMGRFDRLTDLWETWELWFINVEETHTSLAALTFFRSPRPDRSWVTAAGTVLDAAALVASTLDVPRDIRVDMCLRAGYLTLRHIAEFLRVEHNPDPQYPATPITISRAQFEEACERLAEAGVPLKPDRDQAWLDFAGWRVTYDHTLLAMSLLTMAPEAPWINVHALKVKKTLDKHPKAVSK